MAGIDDIYDPSDVSRRLYEIGLEREKILEDKRRRKKSTIETGKNLLSAWKSEQSAKTKELLALKDSEGLNVFEMDPEHLEKSGFKRFFATPAQQVRPVQTTRTETQLVKPTGGSRGDIPDFVPRSETSLPSFTDVTITEPRAAGFLKANPGIEGSETIGGQISESTKGIEESSKKFFGGNLGKWLSGAGTLASGYDLAKNWDKKSDLDKFLGLSTTALGAASLVNPAFGIYALGTSLADMFWD